MTPAVVPTDVAAYLAAVREALADLGPEERDDLLVEVEASVTEAAGDDDRPIAARLGPPEEFAAELRASAGLDPAPRPPATPPPGLVATVRAVWTQAAAHPRVRAVAGGLRELAPLWWLARAYVAVVLAAVIAGANWSFTHRAIPRVGSGRVTVVILAAAVAVSIVLGLRERRRHRRPPTRAMIAANLMLAVAAIPAGFHLVDVASQPAPINIVPFSVAAPGPGLLHDGVPVLNVYPYTRDGRLLHDVLLFDDRGQPLDIKPGDQDPTRRVLTAAGGQLIFDSFPIRYFDPGTTRVSRPNAGPSLRAPSLFTAPARPATPRRTRR